MLVSVDGILFDVHGDYYPGSRRPISPVQIDPPDDAELDIESISIGDQDVTDFLTSEQWQKVHDAAIIAFGEDYDSGPEPDYDD